jgi:glycosyltransferase involved in cell wall biosynthesis
VTARDGDPRRETTDALFVILDGNVMEDAAVLQSQVGEQMLVLQRVGIRTGLMTTTRDPARFDAVIGDRLRAAGIEITVVPHRGRFANIIAMVAALRSVTRQSRVRAAYARGIWGPLVIRLASLANPIRYVYDIRGAVADETIVAGTTGARAKAMVYGALERWCVRRAWRVTTVSRPFADELHRDYGRDDAIVIPSCIDIPVPQTSDSDVQSVRDELGFSVDDLVFVYSGGVDRHQAIPRMFEIWQDCAANEKIRFLILTKSKQLSDAALADFPLLAGKVVRRSVPRQAVSRYLAACDVGFILREPRLMNRVASPVKFAEYAAAGLAVVSSPNIGDMSSLVVEQRIGAIVDSSRASSADTVTGLVADLHRDREGFRRRARDLAAARYSWTAYVPVYLDLYEVSGHGRGAAT